MRRGGEKGKKIANLKRVAKNSVYSKDHERKDPKKKKRVKAGIRGKNSKVASENGKELNPGDSFKGITKAGMEERESRGGISFVQGGKRPGGLGLRNLQKRNPQEGVAGLGKSRT